MTSNDWRLIKDLVSLASNGINKNRIPNDPEKVKEMLHRLEREEKIYWEKQNNIKKIKSILEARKERTKQPDKVSIFYRCKRCHELVRKDEGHRC